MQARVTGLALTDIHATNGDDAIHMDFPIHGPAGRVWGGSGDDVLDSAEIKLFREGVESVTVMSAQSGRRTTPLVSAQVLEMDGQGGTIIGYVGNDVCINLQASFSSTDMESCESCFMNDIGYPCDD